MDYVFNHAAMPYIPDSFRRPLRVFDVNAFGAMKVINAAQEAGVKGILQVSSAEIYGEAGEMLRLKLEKMGMPPESQMEVSKKIDEGASVIPHSSYGAAKAAIDAMVQVRWKEAKTPVMALRQFNCVGERETHPYIVPEIIGQLSKQFIPTMAKMAEAGRMSQPPGIVYLGNNSYRDFMYAGDAVRIAVELLERGEFGEVYNLGSEAGIKMYDLAKLIGKLMGFKDVQVVTDEARVRPYEIWHLQSDNTKIKQVLGPDIHITTVSFNEALERTIQYFKDNGSNWSWETK